MSDVNLKELRMLVDEVINARNKKDAAIPLRKLEFMVSSMRGDFNGYTAGKLGELVDYSKTASGQVKNKEHWVSVVNQVWHVFESDVLNGRSHRQD
jgi:hypothetical protein